MIPNPETVQYLKKFYTVEQIEAFWKQAGDALMTRSTTLIHLTNQSAEGGSMGGLALSTPEEQQAFMAACREAIRLKGEGASGVSPDSLGTNVVFHFAPVRA